MKGAVPDLRRGAGFDIGREHPGGGRQAALTVAHGDPVEAVDGADQVDVSSGSAEYRLFGFLKPGARHARPEPAACRPRADSTERQPNSGSLRRRASASIPRWMLACTSSYFSLT